MAQSTARQMMERAIHLYQAGHLSEAEAIYRRILAQEPNHPDALHLLGCVTSKMGRPADGAELILRAIARDPTQPVFYNNLGLMFLALGRKDEAITAYRTAIALRREFPEALNNLGNLLCDIGQYDQALDCYTSAAALCPSHAEYQFNLGNCWMRKGRAASSPAQRSRHSEAAIVHYYRALALQPDHGDACNNLGTALQEMGRVEQAMDVWRRAAALRPHPDALYNLARALQEQEKLDESLATARAGLQLRPEFADAWNNLGNILRSTAELDAAIASFDRASTLQPNHKVAASNRLYTLYYHPAYDSAAILREHQLWNQQTAKPLEEFIHPHENDLNPDRRLRIGYVSPNFWSHCQALFTGPLFLHHDHQRFEIFCYADAAKSDDFTQRLRGCADVWRDITLLNDEQAAQMIRQDRIDILVDLTLHMSQNRLPLFARKPAPVQATWLGYPGTTGLETMDYRLTDPYLDPPGETDGFYSEKSIRLPNTFWCYDPRMLESEILPEVNGLPAMANGRITFGCLNNFCKVNQSLLELWKRVLQAVPGSRLLLLAPAGSRRQWVMDTLGDRVDFVDRQARRQYLETYHRIDIGLDTLPYNGHTTSLDSLWMGVPVMTLVGKTVAGRAGWSQLSNLGLTELAARTEEEFASIAAELANDLPRLMELRQSLRQRMTISPLMDAGRFAGDIESAYRRMWREWCEKKGSIGNDVHE